MIRQPVDLPPIISVELIQISDKTNIPYAPKARKIIKKVKEEEKRVVSEQAPPAAKAKEKPDRIPLPKKQDKKKEMIKKKQNPNEVKPEIRQTSEFEKKDIIDTNQIAALIDKAKEESAKVKKNDLKLTQSSVKNSFAKGLTLSEADALRAQIFGCWTVPIGLTYDDNFLVNYTVIPYAGVSMIDFRFKLKKKVNKDTFIQGFEKVINFGNLKGLYGLIDKDTGPEVHNCTIFSTVFIKENIKIIGNNDYLQGYFDNENSVNRFYDLASYISKQAEISSN